MKLYLKTTKEDLEKITYLGFDAKYIYRDNVILAEISKETFSFPQFGNITEEQFFTIMQNSEKIEPISFNSVFFKQKRFEPYGFAGNFSYRSKIKEMIKELE